MTAPTAAERGNCYRARAIALRKNSWKYRARWRMAEMELRDVIRILDKRQDAHAAADAAWRQTWNAEHDERVRLEERLKFAEACLKANRKAELEERMRDDDELTDDEMFEIAWHAQTGE